MSALTVTAVAGHIGAEVDGFDVRDPEAAMPALLDALHEHGVVFIRGAHLTDDEQMALARCFGDPSLFPTAKIFGMTEPTATEIVDSADSPPRADYWHTDATWLAKPPAYALLTSVATCERGGDTLWASGWGIYESLSPAMQDWFCTLEVQHGNDSFIQGVIDKAGEEVIEKFDLVNRLRDEYPPVVHPLVRSHPVTGRRSIYWGGRFIRHVVGLEPAESDAVLQILRDKLEDPRFHVRWRWTEGDLAIWDEAQTMHRSAGDHAGQYRSVRRIEVDGGRPFFDPSDTRRIAASGALR
ncbi:MAG: TauD/TfdA family dioxygenase [Actinomycetota bacterium]